MGIGDWGLGIGDWAQSPIPNPQSPLMKYIKENIIKIKIKIRKNIFVNKKINKNKNKKMSNEEIEETIAKLSQKIKTEKNYKIDRESIEIFKKLSFFQQIIMKYPDRGDSLVGDIISHLTFQKFNQFETIWDDHLNYLPGIYIVLLGMINVYVYNLQNKSKSNELNLTMSLNKPRSNTTHADMKATRVNMKSNKKVLMENEQALKIDFIARKGDSIGNAFLTTDNDSQVKFKFRQKNKNNLNEEKNVINKKFYKIESKTKSIVAFLKEEDFINIIGKIIVKERHERINFLHRINYMPKDQAFIEKFQNHITKRCFKKNSTIFEQNEDFKSFYFIVSGSVRLSINFSKHFFCSLDFDVLIGNKINERFTAARTYEIKGNYTEKENFVLVDLGDGEILGGVEFGKNIKNYLATAKCMTNVILYEVDLVFFNNILSLWTFKRFYEKLNCQLKYFKQRVYSMFNFAEEKSCNDNYFFEKNKFFETYKRGNPIKPGKEEYIKRYMNPFKFDKVFKSKEVKVSNTRYNKDFKLAENNKESKPNKNNLEKMPFITNLPKKIKIRKTRTMADYRMERKRLIRELEELFEEKKGGEERKEPKKKIKKKNILQSNSSSTNLQMSDGAQKNVSNRRLQSCNMVNNFNRKNKYIYSEMSANVYETPHISAMKNKTKERENSYKIFKRIELIGSAKSNQRNLYNTNLKENYYTEDMNKIQSKKKLKDSFSQVSVAKSVSVKNRFTPLHSQYLNYSNARVNHKSVMFPSGVQEMDRQQFSDIKELLPYCLNNSYIRNELKVKHYQNVSAFFSQDKPQRLFIKQKK